MLIWFLCMGGGSGAGLRAGASKSVSAWRGLCTGREAHCIEAGASVKGGLLYAGGCDHEGRSQCMEELCAWREKGGHVQTRGLYVRICIRILSLDEPWRQPMPWNCKEHDTR